MRPGSTGLAGGGIYFATTKRDTYHKAHSKGMMLTCKVRLGAVKVILPSGDRSMTFAKLQAQGYDSVVIHRLGGVERVVYKSDQVTDIKSEPA